MQSEYSHPFLSFTVPRDPRQSGAFTFLPQRQYMTVNPSATVHSLGLVVSMFPLLSLYLAYFKDSRLFLMKSKSKSSKFSNFSICILIFFSWRNDNSKIWRGKSVKNTQKHGMHRIKDITQRRQPRRVFTRPSSFPGDPG